MSLNQDTNKNQANSISGNSWEEGREDLKKKFQNGKIPSAIDFSKLIHSTVNKLDDGFIKEDKNGFVFVPSSPDDKILSFRKRISDKNIFFSIQTDPEKKAPTNEDIQTAPGDRSLDNTGDEMIDLDDEYLKLIPGSDNDQNTDEKSFFFHKNGNLGIGKICKPNLKLEVNGFLSVEGRIGCFESETAPPQESRDQPISFWSKLWNYIFAKKENKEIREARKPGQASADGQWHMIICGLDNCNAFEIIARCGRIDRYKKNGKFAMLHAIALSSFGMGKINKTSSYFSPTWSFLNFWNKIDLKWKGTTHNYSLWIRTNSYYGKDEQIFYRITKLWDDKYFTGKGYYYENDTK